MKKYMFKSMLMLLMMSLAFGVFAQSMTYTKHHIKMQQASMSDMNMEQCYKLNASQQLNEDGFNCQSFCHAMNTVADINYVDFVIQSSQTTPFFSDLYFAPYTTHLRQIDRPPIA